MIYAAQTTDPLLLEYLARAVILHHGVGDVAIPMNLHLHPEVTAELVGRTADCLLAWLAERTFAPEESELLFEACAKFYLKQQETEKLKALFELAKGRIEVSTRTWMRIFPRQVPADQQRAVRKRLSKETKTKLEVIWYEQMILTE